MSSDMIQMRGARTVFCGYGQEVLGGSWEEEIWRERNNQFFFLNLFMGFLLYCFYSITV